MIVPQLPPPLILDRTILSKVIWTTCTYMYILVIWETLAYCAIKSICLCVILHIENYIDAVKLIGIIISVVRFLRTFLIPRGRDDCMIWWDYGGAVRYICTYLCVLFYLKIHIYVCNEWNAYMCTLRTFSGVNL